MKTILYACLLIFFCWISGFGQDFAKVNAPNGPIISRTRVTVRVLDKHTLQPVNATIIVVGQKPGKQIVPAFEDKVYKFKIPPKDTSNITIYADGYETLNESISAGKMNSTEVFYLSRTPGNNLESPKAILSEDITSVLYFNQGQAIMLAKSTMELERIADFLTSHEVLDIELAGHTDSTGDPAENFELSSDRAEMIKEYLTKRQIASSRIKSRAFGSKVPVAPNDSEENRKRNRRVEVRVKVR
ncbi:OmpA family protein [Dyadobacter arcticus]|uniref:Outer membrane protein OmpA-like peptidoglycan-associated protein n=1 Tax=Dyadobacter arcticus TaxID=1078754 RepID=A0ABX0UN53_9BACT|nr:OmpA family protein [Dyadobacter arcticus]NIJ52880.1 outer membrane protein OmpA-like peptidoglycan-associated protein [Dyadobacter arcticus]